MTNADNILLIGSVDCNDGLSTTLVAMTLGKPGRSAEEHGGPTVDIAAVGSVDTSQLVESRFTVQVSGASVDAVSDIVASIAAEVRDLADITVGLQGSAYTGTLKARIGECIEIPLERPMDSALMNAHWTRIEIVVRREPWVYGATETLYGTSDLAPASPIGATWPAAWTRIGTDVNLVPNPQYGVNVVDGWNFQITGAPTITRDTSPGVAWPVVGIESCAKVVAPAGGDWKGQPIPVEPLTAYKLTTYLYVPTIAAGNYIRACAYVDEWRHVASGWINENAGFVRLEVVFTTSDVEVCVYPWLQMEAGGGTYYVTGWQLEPVVGAASDYFDGSFAECDFIGTAHNSASSRNLVYASGNEFIITDHGQRQARAPMAASPKIPVVAGKTYGAGCFLEVTDYAASPVGLGIAFYDATSTMLAGTVALATVSAITADTWCQGEIVAPANAVWAAVVVLIDNSAGTGLTEARAYGVEFGMYLATLPKLIPLSTQSGQYATPLDMLLDAHSLTLAGCYVGHTDDETAVLSAFVKPLAGATWSAGAAAADAAGYPGGAGNTVWRHTAAAYTDIDVTDLPAGQYLPLANCKGTTASTDTIETPFSGPVLIPTATLRLLPLGVISLPNRAVRGAGTDLLRVTITGGGAGEYAAVNYVAFLPVGRGLTGYVLPSGHVHTLRWEDGTLYADDAVDLANVYGGAAPPIVLKGQLVALAESETAAPKTNAVLTIASTPRFEQFPS